MKLLYITNGITGSGGLERVLSVKASLLAEQYNYEIIIVSLNEENLSPFYTFNKKIKFYDISVPRGFFHNFKTYISGLRKIVRDFQPDIISVCDDGLKGFFLPKILGTEVPIIYERHVSKEIEMRDTFPFWKKQLIKAKWEIMEKLAPGFSKFVILTEGNLREWPSLKNLQIIPNPLPFHPKNSSSLNNKKVLIVGKQSHQKGQDLLIQAWKIVMEKHSDWVLEIVGKVDESMGLKQQVSKLNLSGKVHFFEPEKNIEQRYLNTSIYVMSSRYEGFGMVLIEAMAYGVPCISFDCPYGPADIINHGEDGLLIENGNIEAFAGAIVRLIENKEERMQMGALAKQHVQRFNVLEIVKQWDTLFKTMIAP